MQCKSLDMRPVPQNWGSLRSIHYSQSQNLESVSSTDYFLREIIRLLILMSIPETNILIDLETERHKWSLENQCRLKYLVRSGFNRQTFLTLRRKTICPYPLLANFLDLSLTDFWMSIPDHNRKIKLLNKSWIFFPENFWMSFRGFALRFSKQAFRGKLT